MTQLATNCGATRHIASRKSLISRLFMAWHLSRQRARLTDLDDAILRDIGLTRAQAAAESRRAFWDVPATWKR